MTRSASLGITAAVALFLAPAWAIGQAPQGGAVGQVQGAQRTQAPPRDTAAPSRDGAGQPRDRETPAPAPTGRIAGRVLAADSGRPVRRARVTLNAPELGGPRAALTEDDGSFSFAELPAGRYNLNVSQQGFIALQYGQRRPMQPGTPIQLAQGQALTGIDFRLPRGSVVSGRVYDQDGEPMVGVMVRVMRYQYANGTRQLMPAGQGQTDDRGQYRVWGLNPGDYYVSATAPPVNLPGPGGRAALVAAPAGPIAIQGTLAPALAANPGVAVEQIEELRNAVREVQVNGQGAISFSSTDGNFSFAFDQTGGPEQQMYAPTYYPGVPSIDDAQSVNVGVSAEALNIDFPIMLVQASRVSGSVVTPDGMAVTQGNVNLTREEQRGRGGPGMNYGGRIQRDGRFSINGVPPGRYLLSARGEGQRAQAPGGGRGAAPTFYASQPLTVASGSVSDVVIPLAPGSTMTGSVRFETSQSITAPNFQQVRINPQPVTPTGLGQTGNSRVENNGTFTIDGMAPGQYWIQATAPQGFTLKSVLVGGRDIVDRAMDITPGDRVSDVTVVFTDRVGEVRGNVNDQRGTPITEYTVVAFPVDETLWRPQSRHIRTARTDQNGAYQVRGLPPGQYYVALTDPTQQGEWFEPEFLQASRVNAKRVTLGEGAVMTENFTFTVR